MHFKISLLCVLLTGILKIISQTSSKDQRRQTNTDPLIILLTLTQNSNLNPKESVVEINTDANNLTSQTSPYFERLKLKLFLQRNTYSTNSRNTYPRRTIINNYTGSSLIILNLVWEIISADALFNNAPFR